MSERKLLCFSTALLMFFMGLNSGLAQASTKPNSKFSLQLSFKTTPTAKPINKTLSCNPASGTHPKKTQACSILRKMKEPFKAIDLNAICAQSIGGPESVRVKGTWNSRKVNSTFYKLNSCETDRWKALAMVIEIQGK